MSNIPTFDDLRAGKATLTVENSKGEHVTFKVTAPAKGNSIDRDAKIRFVSAMVGSDNECSYKYVGILTDKGIKFTRGSKLTMADKKVQVIDWAIRRCVAQELPEGYRIRHNGHCLRCGRKLTNPDSLDIMYGPECAGKVTKSKPVTEDDNIVNVDPY